MGEDRSAGSGPAFGVAVGGGILIRAGEQARRWIRGAHTRIPPRPGSAVSFRGGSGMSKAIFEEWGIHRERGGFFRGRERRRGFVIVKVLGEEAEIDEAKVGSEVGLEGELVGEDAADEIGHVA